MVSPAARGQWLGGSEGETYEIKTEPDRFRHTYFRSPREWVSGGRGFALGAVGKQKTPAGDPLNSFSCRAAMLTAFKSMAGPSPSELLHDPSGFFRILQDSYWSDSFTCSNRPSSIHPETKLGGLKDARNWNQQKITIKVNLINNRGGEGGAGAGAAWTRLWKGKFQPTNSVALIRPDHQDWIQHRRT